MKKKDISELLFEIYTENPELTGKFNSEAAYKRFQLRKQLDSVRASARRRHISRLSVAAAVCLCAISALTYSIITRQADSQTVLTVAQTIVVPDGSKSSVTLPDGTLIWLNGGSRLSYDSDFGKKGRAVVFEGEGLFEVTKNPDSPFTVKSGASKITVLGTRFNFRNYAEEEDLEVTLMEGRIAFSVDEVMEPVEMGPDSQIQFDKISKRHQISFKDASLSDDWIEDRFSFHGEPLWKIVRILNHRFGTNIIFESEDNKNKCFYGYYKADAGVYDILNKMSLNSFKYKVDNEGNIIIK